jgi:hypothetical protein
MERDMAKKTLQEQEMERYRGLMSPPEVFADGFTWRTVIGAIFLGFIMMPGSMYLSLMVGNVGSIATASQWVTIILFAEIARRSLKDLKMQEIYILYFMAGLAVSSPFQGLLWSQFLVQSDYAHAMGVAQEIPAWVAPPAEVITSLGRTFFNKAWLAPIAYGAMSLVITHVDHFGLGYVLYRIVNDIEELPFPMAAVGASGITALTNTHDPQQSWRWRCFSIGGMLGMAYGLIYIAVPAITGAFLPKPLMLIPIPFIDFTPVMSDVLKAVPLNLTLDIGLLLTGMVIPFWAVIGGGLGVLAMIILNPIMYRHGILSNWQPGMDVVDTAFINSVDVYLSISLGLTVAVALIGLGQAFRPLLRLLWNRKGSQRVATGNPSGERPPSTWRKLFINDPKRGDFSIFIALGIYVCTCTTWIGVSTWLIDGFPWKFFIIYATVFTPVISYSSAKLEGLAGQALTIPMVKEATYILSGYRGVQIWFTPVPMPDYGRATVTFRILELTGTKIKSKVKTHLVTIPIIIVASLIFSQLLWKMAPIPSDAYPFAQKMWDLMAKNTCLTLSSTMEGGSLFFEALKPAWLGWGLCIGVGAYIVLSLLGLPTLIVFGLVRGLGQGTPAGLPLEVVGAFLGRFYFRRRFGDRWLRYTPVMLAGYACGMGLIAMVSMAFAILNKMMSPLIF